MPGSTGHHDLQSHFDFFAHSHDSCLGFFNRVAASKENAHTAVALEFRLSEQAKARIRFCKNFFQAAELHVVRIAIDNDCL